MPTTLPVKSGNGRWLNPCPAARARQLMRDGKAVMRSDKSGQRYLLLRVRAETVDLAMEGAK